MQWVSGIAVTRFLSRGCGWERQETVIVLLSYVYCSGRISGDSQVVHKGLTSSATSIWNLAKKEILSLPPPFPDCNQKGKIHCLEEQWLIVGSNECYRPVDSHPMFFIVFITCHPLITEILNLFILVLIIFYSFIK